jgi:hypothetical protein
MRRAFRDKLPFGNFPHGGQTPADGTVAGKARKNAIRLPTSHVVCEMAVVVAQQERHFEPAVCGVFSTNKEPEAEGADRESPRRGFVAAPMADEPCDNEGDQPDATDPHKVMPHRRVSIFSRTFSPNKRSTSELDRGASRGRH